MAQSSDLLADVSTDKLEENVFLEREPLQQSSSAAGTTLEIGANQDEPIAGPSHTDDATKSDDGVPSQDQVEPLKEDTGIYISKEGERMVEDYVILDEKDGVDYKHYHLRESFYKQIEVYLKLQLERCDYYKKVFEQQDNETMATKFDAYALGTLKHLELLKKIIQANEKMPKFTFDSVCFNCLPAHVDVKEREIQLVIRTADLPVANDLDVYVVAEFEFPHPKEEPLSGTMGRWLHYLRIDPKNVLFCSNSKSRQLDMVQAIDMIPFTNPDSKLTEYNRPISFFVDKGKSRTLKRKFKPVKLTFYERRGLFRLDKKLGVVQVRIDGVNDEITSIMRLPLMDGRRQTEAVADIRVKVREPLVNKSLRAHEEKMLIIY